MTDRGGPPLATLNAAVIGLGVGERHVFGYEEHPRCRVVALCDTDPAKLAEVGARHPGRRLTTNPDDILRDPGIGVVSIASYDDAHCAQVLAAFAAGKHVFVEKPLCLHAHELDDIRAAFLARPELRLSSNLILRRSPRFADLRRRIRAGELGRAYYIEGDYNYGRIHKILQGWRGELPGYSVMHGGGIHMIDLILWLTGGRVEEVSAYGTGIATEGSGFGRPDTVVGLLRFADGMLAKVCANFSCVFPHFHNLTVYGTEATFTHGRDGAALHGSRDPDEAPQRLDTPYPGAAKGDMLPAFVAAILDGTEPDVTAAEVFDAMAVSLAIDAAVRLGSPVRVRYE